MLDVGHRPVQQHLANATFTPAIELSDTDLDRSPHLVMLFGSRVFKAKKIRIDFHYPTTTANPS